MDPEVLQKKKGTPENQRYSREPKVLQRTKGTPENQRYFREPKVLQETKDKSENQTLQRTRDFARTRCTAWKSEGTQAQDKITTMGASEALWW